MTSHLHVHLEPGERQRRRRGQAKRVYESAEQLFAEHRPDSEERFPVRLSELRGFIQEFHGEQRAQAVDYAEMRVSPRRFRSCGYSLPEVLEAADQAACGLQEPTVRLILLLNRDSLPEYIEECEDAVSGRLPGSFVGVDLAGNEARFPSVANFRRFFRQARDAGLGTTVHAGEFGDPDNIWRAIDELGAERIGHGTSAGGCVALAARLRADQIMLEVSVTSNVALGAVPALESHPLPWFLENGIPACLNTDVPVHLGTSMETEWQAAAGLLGGDQRLLGAMSLSAGEKSFRGRGAGRPAS